MATTAVNQTAVPMSVFQDLARNGLGAPIFLMLMLSMMVLPLPTFILDILFTFNISLSLVVIMATVYAKRPLDFSAFPTVLLLATLLRLGLNIASTRVVLLHGHTGTAAAGEVIEAFGEFVVGGNYAVGIVVFAILVIINFVVVTKGAGRVSEVSARFTLDAMPGKQMAIDADLNAGLIEQDEARKRRDEVGREADFYGSMDGASKFVRGDAIAGILILFINIIGGLSIGLLQHDMAFTDAMRNYTLLTIGDGLVAQIPSLLLSSATAVIVTRVSASQDMGTEVVRQMFDNPRSLVVTGMVVGVMGLIPGMPNIPFLALAAVCLGGAYWVSRRSEIASVAVKKAALPVESAAPVKAPELSWDDVTPVDLIGLEVGYRVIPLVDKNQGGQLMDRIKGVRKKLSQDLGFLIPPVHIRDNLDLSPNGYRITLMGVPVGESEIYTDQELAINPGKVYGTIPGVRTKDPAFGLEAVWVQPNLRDQAQSFGYTVVDASTVVATHLSHVLQHHSHELLGHEEVQKLLQGLAKTAPKLVENLVPETLPVTTLLRVLQNLLQEGVPIRDIRSIAETLAEHGTRSQDAGILTAAVRAALGRLIVQNINGMSPDVPVITLDPALEQILQHAVQGIQEGRAGLEPNLTQKLHESLSDVAQRQEIAGQPAILLVNNLLRPWLAQLLRNAIPNLSVLAYNEIPDNKQIKVIASIGQ